ncbi:MAG: tetratricopeptide repeat protein [Planctomycetia bacterium]|nr:tetratricopeptide repeat protein [Planctomycetia bacterium]
MRVPFAAATVGCVLLFAAPCSWASDSAEGQADLDRAIELKLTARSIRDLNTVVTLCEGALDKGLGEKNQEFAKHVLASALVERGSSVSEMIFGRAAAPPQWPQMRQIALADLERALQYDATLVEAQLLVARLQTLPGGDRKRAVSAIDEVVRLTADEPERQAEALLLRGGIRETREEGLADLDEAVRLVPRDPKPLRARGAVKLALKDQAGALADFDAALKLEPDDAATHEARGMVLASEEKWDEARASFGRAAELAPESVGVLLERGRVNVLSGDTAAGLADFSEALRLDPENLPALLLRAEVAIPDHPEQALEDLDKAISLRPGLVPALRQRAALLAESKKFAAAASDLQLVRKLEPNDVSVPLQLAAVRVLEGKHAEAVRIYDEALEADAKNWMAYRGRGDAYLNLGKQREAVADYEGALREKPGDSGVLNNLAWVLATSPDEAIRDGGRAIELAKQACEETEYKQPHILSTLAAGYAETGDFNTAIEWSKKAIALGDDALRPALTKELQSYQAAKPWRELQTAAADTKPAEATRR